MLNSAICKLLAAIGLHSALIEAVCTRGTNSTGTVGCAALEAKFPGKTFYPGDEVYEYETQAFWSNTELMNPTCVFRPESASDISESISLSRTTETDFAVRGGGHMGIQGSNNIDDGFLVVLSNLTVLELSDDQSTLTLGPGYKWGAVYEYLASYDLGAAGGRLSPVGVPGLLLAGGVNFYGNQHGWSADNVLSYEVVLANGTIVTASDSENTDLFWALKGGSSNFGIVTSFTLRTFASPGIWAGVYSVAEEHLDDLYAAIANFSAYNTDPLSHMVPQAVVSTENSSVGAVILFYDSATVSYPECFQMFFDIPTISDTTGFTTLYDFAVSTGQLVTDHINDIFFAGTTVGQTYDELLDGVQITNQVFFDALPDLYAVIPFENISLASIDWQPIGSLWQSGSEAANPTGNALGVDPATKGTYLCWAGVVEWIGDSYADAANTWVENTTAAINNATQAAGIYDAFNYMGDAAGFQEIYAGYGSENQAKLLSISQKYDPDRIFQTRLPGGFKIGTHHDSSANIPVRDEL
ncbi:putative FAD binding domain-containing protein [Seiridium cardinale]|uniref:FAD binding domain-containing protein n=1 Tax=Seiridium cardinale TaxID=138064 RepID=A0ABR2X7X1_9PEZI